MKLPKFSKEDITSQILRNSPLTADKFDKEGVTTDANLKALFLNKIPASDELYNTTMPEEEPKIQEKIKEIFLLDLLQILFIKYSVQARKSYGFPRGFGLVQ